MSQHNKAAPNFVDDVFPAELEEIKRRRQTIGKPIDKLHGQPSTNQELVGLAISGGGIRSATFSLGVIQELAKQGYLRASDYLSTVSGGGYTGSCISTLLNHDNAELSGEEFPLKYTSGAAEPEAITHLRNSSNYLTPNGLLNQLRLPSILLRGILLNLFVFMPFIMAAVFITEVAYEKGPNWSQLSTLIFPISMVFLAMTIAFPLAVRVMKRFFDWKKRNWFELWLTIPLLLIVIILFMVPIFGAITGAIEQNTEQTLNWAEEIIESTSFWKYGIAVASVFVVLILTSKASKKVARLSSKLLLTLIGLLGPALVFGIYLVLCLWQIDSPYLPISSVEQLNQALECESACLIKDSTPEEDYKLLIYELEARSLQLSEDAVVTCPSSNCVLPVKKQQWEQDSRVWVINDAPQLQKVCPPLADISPFDNVGVVGNCHYFTRHSASKLVINGNQLNLFENRADYLFVGLFLILLIFNRFFLDMNITSAHGFYRDRLSKAYLFDVDGEQEVIHNDSVKLSELNAQGSPAPYHILNVALNLQSNKEAGLRGRKSDFFILSKRFIGSDRTSYAETRKMERVDNHMDLATAMAISGAAAAPNMGTTTNRSLVFIMTLLNIRLGYWLPNPIRINSHRWYHRLGLRGAKPALIWREALGKLDSTSSHVNISDGGHIENLAIYPLLKRQCKYIVAIDGEADPDMTFNGMVKLMRYARIDMGVEIDLNLEALRKNAEGNSQSHWVMGNIHYGNGEQGKLLYIKLSVVGDEPEYLNAYRTDNPLYPHEPTSDQFFGEDQFEAYRALGEHACKNMFKDDEVNSILSTRN